MSSETQPRFSAMPYGAERLSPNTSSGDEACAAPHADMEASHSNNSAVLHARGIGKTVKSGDSDLIILREIDLEVMAREAVAIVGASGSGKSTLLAILAGLDTPSIGSVHI